MGDTLTNDPDRRALFHYLIRDIVQKQRSGELQELLDYFQKKYVFLQTRPGFDPFIELQLHINEVEEGDLVRLKELT